MTLPTSLMTRKTNHMHPLVETFLTQVKRSIDPALHSVAYATKR